MTPFRRTEVAICVRNSYIASIRVAAVKHRGNQSGNATIHRVAASKVTNAERRRPATSVQWIVTSFCPRQTDSVG